MSLRRSTRNKKKLSGGIINAVGTFLAVAPAGGAVPAGLDRQEQDDNVHMADDKGQQQQKAISGQQQRAATSG